MAEVEIAGHEVPRWAAWAIGGLVALAVVIYVYKRATSASSAASSTQAAAPAGALSGGTSDQALANLQNADATWLGEITDQYNQVLANDTALGTQLTSSTQAFQAAQDTISQLRKNQLALAASSFITSPLTGSSPIDATSGILTNGKTYQVPYNHGYLTASPENLDQVVAFVKSTQTTNSTTNATGSTTA